MPSKSTESRSLLIKPVSGYLSPKAGFAGIFLAIPFFIWTGFGLIGLLPSIVETLGIEGLRIATGATIAGLLLAAIGFLKR